MANILLWNTVIMEPLSNAAALAAVDISGFVNGVTCNIPALGNFYYNSSSSVTADNITVIAPTVGSGRWLIQKPTISHTYRFLGLTSGSIGPSAEIPFTALGYSVMNAADAAAIRTAASCPSTTGSGSSGTWPINVTGYCGNLIGAITSSNGVTSISAGAVNYSNIQNVSAGKRLLGRYATSSGVVQEISLDGTLVLSDAGVLGATGATDALLKSNNLSDVDSVSTSRTNLGLGTVAVKAASDATKTTVPMISSFTSGNYAKFDSVGSLVDGGATPTGALLAVNNLSDVASASTSRTNLGLGVAAVKGVTDATKTNAVMLSTFTSGNYAKFDANGSLVDGGGNPASGDLLSANNLSDVASASTSRTNLGLGTVSTKAASDASKSTAVMLSTFTNGNYAKFDSVGSLVDGGAFPNLTGDVTSSGTVTTIASHATTFAKMQQVATLTLLGNPTGGTADISTVTLGTNLSFGSGALNATMDLTGALLTANNLSELSGTASTARTNLGLGAVAVKGLTDASKTNAVMLSTFTNGNYAKFDVNGSLVDGGGAVLPTMNVVSSSTQVPMSVNQAYYFNGDFNGDLLLPASAAIGDTVYILNTLTYNVVPKTLTIHQNASQNIYLGGNSYTTTGVGGSLVSTIYGTTFALKCIGTNNNWILTQVTVPSIFFTGVAVAAFTSV